MDIDLVDELDAVLAVCLIFLKDRLEQRIALLIKEKFGNLSVSGNDGLKPTGLTFETSPVNSLFIRLYSSIILALSDGRVLRMQFMMVSWVMSSSRNAEIRAASLTM